MRDLGLGERKKTVMVTADNEIGEDQKEVSPPKSPWKTPMVDGNGADVPVMMGTESWPALSDAQKPKNLETASAAKPEDAPASVKSAGEIAPRPPSVQVSLFFIFLCIRAWKMICKSSC